MDAADRDRLLADPWLASLPGLRRDALLAAATIRRFPGGARVYGVGDPPNGLWAVLAGEVRLVGYAVHGLEFLMLALQPVAWFGEVSTLDGGPRPHDAVATGPTRLLHLPTAAYERLAEAHPLVHRDVARLACRHERIALDHIEQVLTAPPARRLARLLLARTTAAEPALRLRQEDLAAMLGLSRQTLNRHLAALVAGGAIARGYGRVAIVDRAALRACA